MKRAVSLRGDTARVGYAILAFGILSMVSQLFSSNLSAATLDCSINPVTTESELNTCIGSAPTNGDGLNIVINNNISLSSTVTVGLGQNVSISSTQNNEYSIFRGGSLTSQMFVLNGNLNVSYITLDGANVPALAPAVTVNNTGAFVMNTNSVIQNSNNTSSVVNGGGVSVTGGSMIMAAGSKIQNNKTSLNGGGIFNNSGSIKIEGEITGNSASYVGGGVYNDGGAVELNSQASINNNIAINQAGGAYSVNSGQFIMNDSSSVLNNMVTGSSGFGGGIGCDGSTFIMNDYSSVSNNYAKGGIGGGVNARYASYIEMNDESIINNNQSETTAGGVYIISAGSSFVMNGGKISENTAVGAGGGAFIDSGVIFTMNDGEIINNTSKGDGGGLVLKSSGEVNLKKGSVSGNHAENNGGGISYRDTTTSNLNISNVRLFGNSSLRNGGAVGIAYGDLTKLNVYSNATFQDNTAVSEQYILQSDQSLYDSHIQATSWSNNLANGYNNYDIQYSGGALVLFKSNGGSEVMHQQVAINTVAIEPSVPTKNHYKFINWYTDKSLNNVYDFSTPVVSNLTLYAKWTEDAKCSYDNTIYYDDSKCTPNLHSAPNTGYGTLIGTIQTVILPIAIVFLCISSIGYAIYRSTKKI